MMSEGNSLREKKLRGSGGYAYAKVTDEEQKKGNLGGPELFLAGIGRLAEDRFSKYYCNKCEREYEGSPAINYENPNEELGEGVTLIEKGQYTCRTCNNILAQYRRFNAPAAEHRTETAEASSASMQVPSHEVYKNDTLSSNPSQQLSNADNTNVTSSIVTSTKTTTTLATEGGFVPIQSLIDMPAYDSEAMLVGKVKEIGLRKSSEGNMQISIKIAKDANDNKNDISDSSATGQANEVFWNNISKIGDIVLLSNRLTKTDITSKTSSLSTNKSTVCRSCGYQNEADAIFCEECGNKLT
jgi:sporulation protein YlmC with PRC-barrel domain